MSDASAAGLDHACPGDVARPPSVVLHPTRECPFRCVYCSTSSSPARGRALEAEPALALLRDAAAEGYRELVLSGGEPLVWPPFGTVARSAREAGFVVRAETSGAGLKPARAEALAPYLGEVAVGIDGRADRHDLLHGRAGAFATAAAAVDACRGAGIPVAIVHVLRQSSLPELDWLVDWATEVGASRLDLRPLARVGRASRSWIGEDVLDAPTLAATRERVAAIARRAELRVDLALDDREGLRAVADRLRLPRATSLAGLLPTLVVEEDGTVVPLHHGFPRALALGDYGTPLAELGDRWRKSHAAGFSELLRRSTASVENGRWFCLPTALREIGAA